jgi:integrative and conjugative element protein (TIGR02256 family)
MQIVQEQGLDRIWFSNGARKLSVPLRALDRLFVYAERKDRPEKGGILLGRVFKDHDEITNLAGPSRSDIANFFSFLRKKEPAQKCINRAWNSSGGYTVYLGEWHTHPGYDPSPSKQDKNMISDVLRNTQMELEYLYLIIGGKDKSCWIGRQDKVGLKHLSLL